MKNTTKKEPMWIQNLRRDVRLYKGRCELLRADRDVVAARLAECNRLISSTSAELVHERAAAERARACLGEETVRHDAEKRELARHVEALGLIISELAARNA